MEEYRRKLCSFSSYSLNCYVIWIFPWKERGPLPFGYTGKHFCLPIRGKHRRWKQIRTWQNIPQLSIRNGLAKPFRTHKQNHKTIRSVKSSWDTDMRDFMFSYEVKMFRFELLQGEVDPSFLLSTSEVHLELCVQCLASHYKRIQAHWSGKGPGKRFRSCSICHTRKEQKSWDCSDWRRIELEGILLIM